MNRNFDLTVNSLIFKGKTELISKLLQDIQTAANGSEPEEEKTFGTFQIVERCSHQLRRLKRFIQQCSGRFLRRATLAIVIT